MKTDVQSLVESNNTFALELYSNLSATEGNLCISPFRVPTALAMTFAGARGVTEMQMKTAMRISMKQDSPHRFQVNCLSYHKVVELISFTLSSKAHQSLKGLITVIFSL